MNLSRERIIHTTRLICGQVLDLFFPQKCASCAKPGEPLCAACQRVLFKPGGQCLICGFRNGTGKICSPCTWKSGFQVEAELPQNLKQVLWAGRYDGALKDAVWELKYKRRKTLAGPLAEMLFQKFSEIFPDFRNEEFFVIPIPLHKNKLRQRGFNQAELLAREFSRLSKIQLLANLLLKVKETSAQVDVQNREARIKNLEGAFSATENALIFTKYKTIILIDDISTTGATLLHASRALASAGAQKIIGLVVAHGG